MILLHFSGKKIKSHRTNLSLEHKSYRKPLGERMTLICKTFILAWNQGISARPDNIFHNFTFLKFISAQTKAIQIFVLAA